MVTGGKDGSGHKTVLEISEAGDISFLPDLKTGRRGHACSRFTEGGDTVSTVHYITLRYSTVQYSTV